MRPKKVQKFGFAERKPINEQLIGLKVELDKILAAHGLEEYSISSFKLEFKTESTTKMIRCCNLGENPEFQIDKEGVCYLSCQIC